MSHRCAGRRRRRDCGLGDQGGCGRRRVEAEGRPFGEPASPPPAACRLPPARPAFVIGQLHMTTACADASGLCRAAGVEEVQEEEVQEGLVNWLTILGTFLWILLLPSSLLLIGLLLLCACVPPPTPSSTAN